jgi:acyl-CoA thioester hydrolase
MAAPFLHELRVRYAECDPQGIVFNANYLVYFDVAFTELWREAAGPWQKMIDQGVEAVVAESNIRYRAPARNDELLQLHMGILRLGQSAITTEFAVMRDDDLLVEGQLRHVCVASDSWQKTEIPRWVRAGLERFVIADEHPLADGLKARSGA